MLLNASLLVTIISNESSNLNSTYFQHIQLTALQYEVITRGQLLSKHLILTIMCLLSYSQMNALCGCGMLSEEINGFCENAWRDTVSSFATERIARFKD